MTWENILKNDFEVVEEYSIYDDPKFYTPKQRDRAKKEMEEAKRRVGRDKFMVREIPDMEQVRHRNVNISLARESINDALELVDLFKDIPSVDKMKVREMERRIKKIATMLQSSKLIRPM
tara:strand:+ start:8723 stop:9082 length:360 start_codon:yes stop_codon:yes gene_type:complete